MKRILALALAAALVALGLPLPVAAGQQTLGSIAGVARDVGAKPLANSTVRLRNVSTGGLAATTTSNASGAFSFTGLSQGSYVIEVVNAAGQVIATSSAMTLTAGAMTISGIALTASAAAAGAAGAAAAAGGIGSFFTSTAGIVLLAAAGAGATAGIIVATGQASPTR